MIRTSGMNPQPRQTPSPSMSGFAPLLPMIRLASAVLVLAGLSLTSLEAAVCQDAGKSGTATITGTVRGRFQDRVRPLPGAFVDVRSAHRGFRVEADESGSYELAGLPVGALEVRVDHPGYHPVRLTVHTSAGRVVTVDLELTAAPLTVKGLEVRASTSDAAGDEAIRGPGEPTLGADPELEVRLLEISPSLGEAGIVEAIQALPGNDPADPTDVLFMRGSTTELKLVLLDGIPVYTPFHVAGLLRSFEPTVLGGADLHVGGAPARYDGGLTHILDLRTRSPRRDRARATGSIDLLSASTALEVPVGDRGGILASARTLHDLGEVPLGGERPYGYGDVLLRADVEPASDHLVRATGFWNGESVHLDFPTEPSDARWSNRAGSVAYDGRIGSAELRITAGGSRYEARLPLQPAVTEEDPDPSPILASADSDRRRVDAQASWSRSGRTVRVGTTLERIDAAFHARSLDGSDASGSRGRTYVAGAFVETMRPVTPTVSVRLGLRGDVFSGAGPRLSPRVALFWELAPEAILSVAAGRYHQVTRTPDDQVDEALQAFAGDSPVPVELLPVATADHLVLSLDQRIGESVGLGIQGFWKRFDGLAGTNGEPVLNSGLDVQVLNDLDGGAVWLGYGLSWFWSPTDLSGSANEFAGRHLLSTGISGALFGPLRGEARMAYGAGLPSTSIPFGSHADEATAAPDSETPGGSTSDGLGSGRSASDPRLDESFLRLDLELHAVFEPAWGERRWRIRPYLRLLNALNRRDALFYQYQPWRPDSVRPLAERPILPLLGVAFAF